MKTSHLTARFLLTGGFLLALGLLIAASATARGCRGDLNGASCTRVLFIGNSYTSQHDLPGTFAALATAGGRQVETTVVAEGGWRLADHAAARETLAALEGSRWTYVVLQEQSQIPSVEQFRVEMMYPAARTLARHIRAEGAEPVLFMTWGHRGGWPERRLKDYASMQAQISHGYRTLADALDAPVAPVGEAWALVRRRHPGLELWEADGSHPAPAGTYLAACVFYATLFGESPEGLAFTAGLPKDTARALQTIAAEAVLPDATAP